MRLFRLFPVLPFALAATALLPQAAAGAAPSAGVLADRESACVAPTGHAFPLTTRIHGGPEAYEPGGAGRTWFIDLKNTTAQSCGGIHPVVVLVDFKRTLTVAQPKLEFFEGDRAHPVTFEHTARDELVGAFDDGFAGFTVAPGQTLAVKVRLTLAPGTKPNDVMAKAAIVQRQGGDGDWVGESNYYRFRIDGGDGHADDQAGTPPASDSPSPSRAPSPSSSSSPLSAPPASSPAPTSLPSPVGKELANTGPQPPHGISPTTVGLLLVAGGGLVAACPFLLRRR
ncbi:hypothetical protein [Streptomyces sp. NPDC007264]|uniref:hypothetical protein n=1 Tax=Streptomyces sp. NPDC007264 TaxID=3364777 RepID=UPI0036DEC73A